MSNRDSVSVVLPRSSYRIAMTEQAFVAVSKFRNRFANVIAAPGFWVERLWGLRGGRGSRFGPVQLAQDVFGRFDQFGALLDQGMAAARLH